jgi:hypothetical protein
MGHPCCGGAERLVEDAVVVEEGDHEEEKEHEAETDADAHAALAGGGGKAARFERVVRMVWARPTCIGRSGHQCLQFRTSILRIRHRSLVQA